MIGQRVEPGLVCVRLGWLATIQAGGHPLPPEHNIFHPRLRVVFKGIRYRARFYKLLRSTRIDSKEPNSAMLCILCWKF
jgi:hypothetical protein